MTRKTALLVLTACLLCTSVHSQQTTDTSLEVVDTRSFYPGEKLLGFFLDLSVMLRTVDDEKTATMDYEEKSKEGIIDSAFLLNHYDVETPPDLLQELRSQAEVDWQEIQDAQERARNNTNFFEALSDTKRSEATATANALRILQAAGVDIHSLTERVIADPMRSGTRTWLNMAPTAAQDQELQQLFWSILGDRTGVNFDREEY